MAQGSGFMIPVKSFNILTTSLAFSVYQPNITLVYTLRQEN